MVEISETVKIAVSVGEEKVVFECRRPTSEELSKFLNGRFTSKRNKMESKVYPARSAFFDRIALDVTNVTFKNAAGLSVPLNAAAEITDDDKRKWAGIMGKPINSWKDLIAENWKSAVAMRFEDSGSDVSDDEEEGDSKN